MLSRIFRISHDPGKTLLYFWLKKFLTNTKGKSGVDLAGGSMLNKRFFKTKEYICVDINKIKLDEGKIKNPEAKALNLSIEEYLSNISNKPDILICVQTMGTNNLFKHDETLRVVKLMYDALNEQGSMVFNIGSYGVNIDEMEKLLSEFFKGKFEQVDKRFYGVFNNGSGLTRWKIQNGVVKKKNLETNNFKSGWIDRNFSYLTLRLRNIFSLLTAFTMHFFIPLRTLFGIKRQKLYFSCKKKL